MNQRMSEIPFLNDLQLAIFSCISLPTTKQDHKLFRDKDHLLPIFSSPLSIWTRHNTGHTADTQSVSISWSICMFELPYMLL